MSRPVRLTIVADEGEAEVVCRLLRANGVACAYRNTDVASGAADAAYAFGGMREVLVGETDLARARELIAEPGPAFDECVVCGREVGEDGGWYPNEAGELEPYCVVCAERSFGAD